MKKNKFDNRLLQRYLEGKGDKIEPAASSAEIYSPLGARTSFVLPDGTYIKRTI